MKRNLIKAIIFMIGLIFVYKGVEYPFRVVSYQIRTSVTGFYDIEEKTLDAVYIGASNVFAFFQAPLAWEEYGYTIYPYAIPSMPAHATKYMIEEVRKTQPDATMIINLNQFKSPKVVEQALHMTTNYLPFSKTKINLINDLTEKAGISGLDVLEYYFPLIRFHSGWPELTAKSFEREEDVIKGGAYYYAFLRTRTDVSSIFRKTDQKIELTNKQETLFEDLLTYCETNNVKILFTIVPQAINDETTIGRLNTMEALAKEKGFDVLNLLTNDSEIGLEQTQDYYDKAHLNIHGSLKFTSYFCNYLKENYGFEDKRGNEAFESWDKSYEEYLKKLTPYVLDFELNHSKRDYSLEKPVLSSLSAKGTTVEIKWNATPNAENYLIYRKTDGASWKCISTVAATKTFFVDKGLAANKKYYYTVVPMREKNDVQYYGTFDIVGESATTKMDAPKLKEIKKENNQVTLTWEKEKGVDGYAIYRKLNGQDWIKIADGLTSLSYKDKYIQKNYPYVYSVASYKMINGVKTYSYYDRTGLLSFEELESPQLSVEMTSDSGCELTWEAVKGADSYFVYKKVDDGEWVLLKKFNGFTYREDDVAEGTTYKVSAVLTHGKDVYEYPSEEILVEREAIR